MKIEDGGVVVAVGKEPLTIVCFVEPDAAASKSLLLELTKAGRMLSREGMNNPRNGVARPTVRLLTVDVTAHPEAAAAEGLTSFPWMLLYDEGAKVGDVSVSGPRRDATEAIVNLVWERQEGPSTLVVSAEDAMGRVNSNRKPAHMVSVVGLFGEGDETSSAGQCFQRVAKLLRDHVQFLHS